MSDWWPFFVFLPFYLIVAVAIVHAFLNPPFDLLDPSGDDDG